MNKADLIDAIAADAGLSKADAGKALDAALANITKALAGGDSVALIGFGTYSVAQKEARTGRNPQTGQPIQIPARKAVKFTVGKALKDAVQ